jgi:hypothetical protein
MKGKTHKERVEIREAMKAYKAEGHTMQEVADKFGYSKQYVQRICQGIAPQKATPEEYRNQYTNGVFDREANAIKYINERTPWFEYAGNFTGLDGYVDLKCKTCGAILHKSFVCVKHAKAECPVCKKRETERKQEERKRIRDAELEKKRAEKQQARFLNQKFNQIDMKVCPVCNNVFIGRATYCSPKCRDNNKWRMKDGYRYLFPLEDVYERDNGICYLCGGQCDWNDYEERDGMIIYGNMYPSRDHMIPKSRGGSNSWDNIRLAHRICNSLKADSPSVEKLA